MVGTDGCFRASSKWNFAQLCSSCAVQNLGFLLLQGYFSFLELLYQTWWLKTTEILFSHSSEGQKVSAVLVTSEGSEGESVPSFSPSVWQLSVVSGIFLGLYSHHSNLILTWLFSPFLSLIRICSIGLRAHPTSIMISSQDPYWHLQRSYFQIRLHSWVLEVRPWT